MISSAYAGEAQGKPFNPDISVNFLGLAQDGNQLSTDRAADSHKGASLQEAELQILSDVDPYLTANALLSISPNGAYEYGIDPEEVYAETTFIPSLTLRFGKYKAAFGKHNTLHTHAYPFIDAPLINQLLFGTEGLNDAGLSASWMAPTPWFMELTVQAMSNRNQTFLNSASSGDYFEVAQLKNLWDLSDDTTVEWAIYGLQGANQFAQTSTAYGSDLIFKWRPSIGGKYHALWWANEYMDGNQDGASSTLDHLGGLATWLQFQFAERWWVQGRYEYVGVPHDDAFSPENKQSVLLGFYPSEFSGFRVQLDHTSSANQPSGYAVAFQTNIVIGAHPAHSY